MTTESNQSNLKSNRHQIKPYKLTAKIRKQYLTLLRQGQTLHGAAEAVGVTYWTVWLYRKNHPEFDEAIRETNKSKVAAVEDRLYAKALEGDMNAIGKFLAKETRHYKDPRDRWDLPQSIELSGPGGGPVENYTLTREERLARLKAITEEVKEVVDSAESLPKLDEIIKKEDQS